MLLWLEERIEHRQIGQRKEGRWRERERERDVSFTTIFSQAMKRAEQYQKQLYRAEEDRRQALATSEALTALWQKKFEKAQNENYDLRSENSNFVYIHVHFCVCL